MSILFPDRNGVWSAVNDSRLSLDSSGKTGWLVENKGLLLIGVGNPLLHQDYYTEYSGGRNTTYHVISNQTESNTVSPGYWALFFGGWDDNPFENRFVLKFTPNGGTQSQLVVTSPVVTHTNCAYVGVERDGNNYAIHLYDAAGVKTAGTPVAHDSGSLGMTMRSSHRTVYVGSSANIQAEQIAGHWRTLLENLVLIERNSNISQLDAKVANVINGSDPVSEFGAGDVKIWRTLEDLTAAGLAAESTATSDTLPAIAEAAFSRAEVGSPIAAPFTQCVRLDERKYNFYGLQGNETTTTISLAGTYLGTVTNVEGRLLDKSDDSEVQTWTTLEASVTGGTWSGSFSSVPAGEYYVELRPSNATANVYKGRNYHTVAYVMLLHGQSQLEIASEHIAAIDGLFTPAESVPSTARSYYVGCSDNSTLGSRVSFMRMSGEDDYGDVFHAAQVEWERYHSGVPVVWCRANKAGSSLLGWLNNTDDVFGDGANWNSGILTDIKLALGTDKVNIIYQWITSNLGTSESEYRSLILGWLYDEAGTTDYSGPTYKHVTDLFDSNFGFALSPPARAVTNVLDNYTADPVFDDYANIAEKRELQRTLVAEWDAAKANRFVVGPAVADMYIESAGGPHQPGIGAGSARFAKGTPRLGSRLGLAAAWLASASSYTPPSLGAATFTDGTKAAFNIAFNAGSFGALKNGSGTSSTSGFEISTDGGSTWNRKGFTAAISGSNVVITKSTGDWSSVADGDLRWRYHKGGPYSYGTSYVTEAEADVDIALYATDSAENSLGIPVEESTNLTAGNSVANAAGENLLADDVQSLSEINEPEIGQTHAFGAAANLESLSQVSAPALNAGGTTSESKIVGGTVFVDNQESLLFVSGRVYRGSAAAGGGHDLLADDVQSLSEVSAPAIGQTHALEAGSVESLSQVSAPALIAAHPLLADSIESLSQVDAPALGQTHPLQADSVQSLTQVSAPGVGQTHQLGAVVSLESLSQVSAPALTPENTHNLLAEDIESLSQLSAPAIGGPHNLFADSIQSLSTLSSPAIAQTHALGAAVDLESLSTVSAPNLVSELTHNLLAEDVESASKVSVPALTQTHALQPTSVQSRSQVSSPAIVVKITPSTIEGIPITQLRFRTAGDSNLRMGAGLKILNRNEVEVTINGITATFEWDGVDYSGPATEIATYLAGQVGNAVPLKVVY